MAEIAPLFVADRASLLSALRLTSVAGDSDTSAIIDSAIRESRNGFVRRLGPVRVAELVAMDYDPTGGAPATQDEILRETANLTEIMWVRKILYCTLPTFFRDSSGETRLDWQRDGLTRETGEPKREAMVEELSTEIEINLELLEGSSSTDDEPTWKATTIEPKIKPLRESSAYNNGDNTVGPYEN